MNITEWVGVIGISLATMTGAGGAGKWVADQLYVSQDEFLQSQVFELDKELKQMELKEKYGILSDQEKEWRQYLQGQADALRQKISPDE